MNNQKLYLNTNTLRLFFKAALPGSISMLAATLYIFFDGIFVGQILGTTAFAAVNLAFPFVIINFSLADLIGVGSSVPISISLGKKEDNRACNIFTCAVIMIILTGLFMGFLLYFAAPYLMMIMGAKGELAEYAVQYIRVYAISSPITTIVFALDNYLRICEKIKTSMFLNIFMSLFTVILEFLFLDVFKWGVWSAAFANAASMGICALFALAYFSSGKLHLKFRKPCFSFSLTKQIISNGSPIFLNNVSGRIASIIMSKALIVLGGAGAITIYGVMMYAAEFVQPILYGVYDSLQPAISYNFGAGEINRVKKLEKYCLVTGAVVSSVAVAFMLIFPQTIATMFLKPEELNLLEASARAVKIFSFAFITRWFGFAIQSFLIALERPLPATIISVSSAFVFPVVLIPVLWGMGLDGLWINGVLTSFLVALLAGAILIKLRKTLFVISKKQLE